MPARKSNIHLEVGTKAVNAYLASPEKGGAGILVLHAWWGLNPFFKKLCERLAQQGYIAMAPDLRNGQVAASIANAKALMEKSDPQFSGETVLAAKDYLLALPDRKGERIGVIGFSMGANWSLMVATHDPDKIAATVLFYGTNRVDFNNLKSKVIGHFSDNDEWEPMEDIRTMESAMKASGVDVTIHIYPKAGHWFVEEGRPEYDPAVAKLAWDRTFDFLKRNL